MSPRSTRWPARRLSHERRRAFAGVLLARALLAGAVACGVSAAAQHIVPDPPQVAARGYVLMDADTLDVLAESNADERLPPASLTKIMTSYVAASELEAGRIDLADSVPISVNAWRTPGSRTFLRDGTEVGLADLLRGIIIQSGNDASVAVAEYIAGAEDAFADMMNSHGESIGLTNSHFTNATGLPSEAQYSTAKDMALIARALIRRYPEHYAIYSERAFEYNGIEQPNRNRLLWRDRTVDGVKTGHTDAAGYCLVASAERDGMRLISVVMGAESDGIRMRESQKLLAYGFRYFETRELYDPDTPLKVSEVWYGESDTVSMGVSESVVVTIPRGRYDDLEATMDLPRAIEAPVTVGQELGELRVSLDDRLVVRTPLVAREAVAEAGFFSRFFEGIAIFFRELVT
ncbi:MAG: D-alanyl-D-alanine carboxypeptidase [Gammaproteobacteria bacterium]|nr:D-alanyl-D-alanine carboxypeptidase [Gammaproteobacteria bacterium]